MRRIHITFTLAVVVYVLLTSATSAQLSGPMQVSLAEQYRQSMGLEPTVAKIKAGDVDAKRLAILQAVLSATPEDQIHKQRGAAGNKVYVHADGHQEAVYDPDGQLVSDGINDASYNYFHPTTDAVRHYFFDIHPWIIMGSSRQDPTMPKERVSSFVADFGVGIVQAATTGDFPAVDIRGLRDGELEAYAIFLNAIAAENANELFEAVESQAILDNQLRSALLAKVERSLHEMYAE